MEKFREWVCHIHKQTSFLIGADNLSEYKRTYDNIPESDRFQVIEKAAFDELMGIAEEMQYALKEGDQFNKHKALSDFEDFKQKLGGGE